MTAVNEKQVGGEHYKSHYQHWDFITDTGAHYLLGCATKYLTRHRKKNGKEDLEKSIHYLEKAETLAVCFINSPHNFSLLSKFFTENLPDEDCWERQVLAKIFHGQYQIAITDIREVIKDYDRIYNGAE